MHRVSTSDAYNFFPHQIPSAGVGADLCVCPRNRNNTFTFTTLAFAGCAVLNDAQPVGHGKGGHAGPPLRQPADAAQNGCELIHIHLQRDLKLAFWLVTFCRRKSFSKVLNFLKSCVSDILARRLVFSAVSFSRKRPPRPLATPPRGGEICSSHCPELCHIESA